MKCYRRTDVPRDAIKTVTHSVFATTTGFDYQMFLIVGKRSSIFQIQQDNPRVRHLRADSLVAQVQAKAVLPRLADDAREE